MKLPKFLSLAAFITFFSLVYVYQQSEIFRLAYVGQKKMVLFQDCLDKNTILRYNIKRNTSLIRIDGKVYNYANFEIPGNYRLVKLTYPQDVFKVVKQPRPLKQENLVFRLFGIKREAQAKTINPALNSGQPEQKRQR
ncbi:MAG: hypothetical protein PHC54_03865 [Candidatus Omnitrophica bacterium]|nr:hypothetical protein [Candidatus Omnitrophota bacterium]MDD5592313.1 hypothetical protein [Candidatus Omnitrophota bacterium]